MSQWGKERRFENGGASIIVLPNVDTGGAFDPVNLESKIDYLALMSTFGDRVLAGQLFEQIKQQYVGSPYAEWLRHTDMCPEEKWSQCPAEQYPERDMNKFHNAGIAELPPCIIRQWGDMTGCVKEGCGLRWDTNDPEPPLCPAFAIGRPQSHGNARRVSQAQARLSALYSGSPGRLSAFLWTGLPLSLAFGLSIAYLGWFYGPHIVTWLAVKWLSLGLG